MGIPATELSRAPEGLNAATWHLVLRRRRLSSPYPLNEVVQIGLRTDTRLLHFLYKGRWDRGFNLRPNVVQLFTEFCGL